MIASALSSRAEQLSLQPLYARPPPIWLHPTFAAEFADPFIADTPFEESAMHVSLEVSGVGIAMHVSLEVSGVGIAMHVSLEMITQSLDTLTLTLTPDP